METRNVSITLKKAKEWYNSDNAALKKIALQAFSEEELNTFDFTKIKSFEDALRYIYKSNSSRYLSILELIEKLNSVSKASAAMFMLNIVREVLNTNYNLHFTRNTSEQALTWFPCFVFTTEDCQHYEDTLCNNVFEKFCTIQNEGIKYTVLVGVRTTCGDGLGCWYPSSGIGTLEINIGLLGCATKEIAEHLSRYFGELILKAVYGDIADFKIIE